jgi:hypothetical protein
MPSWLVPMLVGVVIAGIGVGLLISYIILKRQNKKFPLFMKQNRSIPVIQSVSPPPNKSTKVPADIPKEAPVKEQPVSVSLAEDTLEKYLAKTQGPQAVTTAPPQNGAAIIELEKNLEIALLPTPEKLINFQTDVWNTRRSEFNLANNKLLGELTEAYVDMLLANNIVWLVTELGRDSPDLRISYTNLKNKVAERLKRVLPEINANLK